MSKPDFNSHSHFRSFPSKPDYTNDLPSDQLQLILGETPKEKTPKEKKRKKKNTPDPPASRQRVSNTTAGSTTTPAKQRVEVIEIGMLFS